MRQLHDLRRIAAGLYTNEIKFEETRAILFVKVDSGLIVAPGYFSNFDDPVERTICLPEGQGITGVAFSRGTPNTGIPGRHGELEGQLLPVSEQEKVFSDLTWVVAWPLGDFGAVCVDGFPPKPLTEETLHDLKESPALQRAVENIADVTRRI